MEQPPDNRSSTSTSRPSAAPTSSAVWRARTLGLLMMRSGRMSAAHQERTQPLGLTPALGGQRPELVRPVPRCRVAGVGVADQVHGLEGSLGGDRGMACRSG